MIPLKKQITYPPNDISLRIHTGPQNEITRGNFKGGPRRRGAKEKAINPLLLTQSITQMCAAAQTQVGVDLIHKPQPGLETA